MTPTRRSALLLLTFGSAGAALTGCGSSSSSTSGATTAAGQSGGAADPAAFPVTLTHSFGETTITRAPTRVATLGWSDQDMVVALGVVPVGATAMTWGGNAGNSTDWFDAAVTKLGGAAPVRYDDTDGIPVNEIAKLAPDLILATNSGLTKEDYAKLSKIAPTVAQPGAPWVTEWTTSLEMVGKALGRQELAATVRADTERVIEDAKAANGQLAGKSVVFAYLTTTDLSTIGIYGADDNRVRTLEAFGLATAAIVHEVVKKGEFYATLSAERAATVESDILLTYAETPADLDTFKSNPLLGQIPALKAGRVYAETDKQIGLSITNPSPLSLPYIVEKFLPSVVKAASAA